MGTKNCKTLAKAKSQVNLAFVENFACTVTLALPIIANIYWLATSASLPHDDAACYLRVAYEHFKSFFNTPIVQWLHDVYFVRGWTQTLFPILALPFIFLFGGNTLLAITCLSSCLYAILNYYAFKIGKLYIGKIHAAIATVTVTTIGTYFLHYTTILNFAESAWLPFSVIAYYYILKSEQFKNSRETKLAALFLALAITVRPFETLIISIIPLWMVLNVHLHHSLKNKKNIVFAFLYSGISVLVLSLSVFIKVNTAIVLLISLSALAVCIVIRERQIPERISNIEIFSLILCAINLLWWAPLMPKLFFYAYQCTFGEVAARTDNHAGVTGMLFTINVLADNYGIKTLAFLLLTCCASYLITQREKQTPHFKLFRNISCGMLFPIIIMLFITGTSTPRRCYVAVFFLALYLAAYSMKKGPLLMHRTAVMAIFCIIQLQPMYPLFFTKLNLLRTVTESYAIESKKTKQAFDNNFAIIAKLQQIGIKDGSNVAVFSHAAHNPKLRCYEVWSLLLAQSITNSGFFFSHPSMVTPEDIATGDNLTFSHALIDTANSDDARYIVPYSQTVQTLCQKSITGSEIPGLKLVAKFELCGRLHYLYEATHSRAFKADQQVNSLNFNSPQSQKSFYVIANNFSDKNWKNGIFLKDDAHTFYFIIPSGVAIPVSKDDSVTIAGINGKVSKITSCTNANGSTSIFVTTTFKIPIQEGGYPNKITITRNNIVFEN